MGELSVFLDFNRQFYEKYEKTFRAFRAESIGRPLIEPEQSIMNQNSNLLPSGCLLSCDGGVKSSFRFKLRLISNPTFDPKSVL